MMSPLAASQALLRSRKRLNTYFFPKQYRCVKPRT